ncbi:hypothetical protein SASPL_141510 [Salvia splendens]|uniref:Uncharacterized protein n=1 Tax=Salvia splendens TaxID=180675 RepID=A0A8X8ZCV6_SALSN|nr:hypothetical protein SASPL_141510 [Salvia splendens]
MDTQPHARPQHRNLLHQARQSPRHHCHFSRTFQRVLEEAGAVFDSRPDAISAQITSDGYLTLALSPSGDQWAKMRRVMRSGVLSNAVFQWLHEKRREEADHLVRYVYKQCKNPDSNRSVNVRDTARHYCGNVIRKMVFGERFFGSGMADGGAGVEEREHVDGLFAILSCLYGFAIADFLPWLEVSDLDGHKKKITNAIKNVRRYQDPEIKKRIEMWEKGLKSEEDDILNLLINLKKSGNEPLLSI